VANTFFRKAITGADNNNWAQYNDAFNLNAIGDYSCYLYDDSGTLTISKGRVGIDNGSVVGVSEIDTITTISMAGVTNSNWAKIEMSVSGSAVTFTALDISGENDPASFPGVMSTSYNGEKQGYYIDSTKRVIGVVWKNSGGTLDGVVNVRGADDGYVGYSVDTSKTPDLTYRWDREKGYAKSGVPWGNPWATPTRKLKAGVSVVSLADGATARSQDYMFNLVSPYLDDGVTSSATGYVNDISLGYTIMWRVVRNGNTITFQGLTLAGGLYSVNATSGNAGNLFFQFGFDLI